MKKYIAKGSIKASKRLNSKKFIKASTEAGMLEDIYINKDAYINEWQRDYNGTPATSWDNIFEQVVHDFSLYADDEASAHVEDGGTYGPTIKERYDSGEIDAETVMYEFDEWANWLDLNDYDV